VGSGDRILSGWVNIDLKRYEGVDLAADVRHGLPFKNVSVVFAEHFLEHLEVLAAVELLLEAHRVLIPRGKLRLSTPNLDWVWRTHDPQATAPEGRSEAALVANRAFYGWGHRFLWNRTLLQETLEACGFTEIRWLPYGWSEDKELRDLERHETYADLPGCPHTLIVEAEKGDVQSEKLHRLKVKLCDDFVFHLPG
jgi:predicted SAM-dependent methyltransferase